MNRLILATMAAVILAAGLCGCHRASATEDTPAPSGTAKAGAPVVSAQPGRVPGSNLQFGTKAGGQ